MINEVELVKFTILFILGVGAPVGGAVTAGDLVGVLLHGKEEEEPEEKEGVIKNMPLEANNKERLTGEVDGSMVLVGNGETTWEGENISVVILVVILYEG